MTRFASGCLVLCLAGFSSCRDGGGEVSADETRRLTTKDVPVKLHATSDERFRGVVASPLAGEVPGNWLAQPATQFRLLNHRFGASGKGEVYATVASGGVLENVNRWLGQFGMAAMDGAGLAALRRVPVLGGDGVWVEAKGVYRGMAGRQEEAGFALAGVVVEAGGRLVTVKMTGPEAEVEAEKAALEAFVRSLRFAETAGSR